MKNKYAFTLAEMMVVMLILSIVLAAFAPVMTTRQKRDISSPWRYSDNQSDAYFALGNEQRAMIGQKNRPTSGAGDPDNRLTIQTSRDTQSHILFKQGDTVLGRLHFGNNSISLGTRNPSQGSGVDNISIGNNSLQSNTSGNLNVAIGLNALYSNTSSDENTAIGSNSLYSNNNGNLNVALGSNALYSNTSADDNTAIGSNALYNNNGNYNTAVGSEALYANESGEDNTAIGKSALQLNQSGQGNTSVGSFSMQSNTTGGGNTALGFFALNSNTTASSNTAVGSQTLNKNTTGSENMAIGYQALYHNTTGFENTANGYQSLYTNITGYDNSAHGAYSLYLNSGGSYNAANGAYALYSNNTGSYNTASGYQSLYTNTSGKYNTAYGYQAMSYNTSGYNNTAVGTSALFNNTTGQSNVVIGRSGAYVNTTGSENIAIGGEYTSDGTGTGTKYGTLGSNKTGDHNIAIGVGALPKSTNNNNIAIGAMACENVTTGYNKICIGNHSGPKTTTDAWATDGAERVFIGSPSKFNGGAAVLEVHNDGVWRNTLRGGSNDSSVVINGNLILKGALILPITDRYGNNAKGLRMFERYREDEQNASLKSHEGDFQDFVNAYYLGDHAGWNAFSDKRLKYVGNEFVSGLDKIKQLKVFNYTFKDDKKKTPHVGVIAQDLQKIFPDAVIKNAKGFLTIRMEDMFFAMVNAVKELSAKIDNNEQKIKQLENENKELKAILKQVQNDNRQLKNNNSRIEARLKALEARIK